MIDSVPSNWQGAPPPEGLDKKGIELWVGINLQYRLNEAEKATLEQAARELDLIGLLERSVKRDGVLVEGSRGQLRINPAIPQIAQHRTVFDRLLQSLALPLDGEAVGRRRNPQAKQAATLKWKNQQRRGRIASVNTSAEGA